MKLLLTENRLNDLIKDTLLREFPSIYTVIFQPFRTLSVSDGKSKKIVVTHIQIYLVPENLQGVYPLLSSSQVNLEAVARQRKKEIYQFVKNHFPVEIEEFGSDWNIDFFGATTKTLLRGDVFLSK